MNRPSILVTSAALALSTLVPVTVAAPAAAAPLTGATSGPAHPGRLADSPGVEPEGGHRHPRVLSVRGAGAYRIGASLAALTAAGRIDWVAPGCAGVVHAGATGSWAGVILLAFRDGRLVEVGTATAPPRSPAGATVGMSFAELEEIYGRRGSLIRTDAGDAEAYLVRVGSRVELFTGHPIRPGVGYFQVGPADFVERNFRQGTSC
ncbi:hypothetical protein DKT68_24030 [Micromonospora acroterricola]|uniref:Uncharacterized protein n=1 Tax=Micromonospora acroterricola TaxID=2202421 RepID=A0A317CUD2_9ACTN|nr:hypothetical protein [Micromonospora acroterricola]PWR05987.1 hypothetical protein DKT68_24030 [Micromonospora acroterricola]